ncbi:MAG: response regulator [candidate division Zixibacteria bacterium]|nr:response regulator [candidate division Zixibacteria bacterium]
MAFDGRILVADDESIIREFVAEVLEEYEVIHAVDGQDAIDKIPEVKPDLIITDIKMPGRGGNEVIKFAKRFDAQIPVIVITGYTSLDIANECVRLGADGFLSKPFTIAQLRQEVTRCFEERHGASGT